MAGSWPAVVEEKRDRLLHDQYGIDLPELEVIDEARRHTDATARGERSFLHLDIEVAGLHLGDAMSVIEGPAEDRHGGSGPWSAIAKAAHRSLQPRMHEGGVVSGIETEHEHPFEAGRA